MNSRIIRFGLLALAVVVVVVIVLNLRPMNKTAAQVASSPTPSPVPSTTPGKLAYALHGHIYLANWDGSHPVRIANGGTPTWSPDGRYLAYVGDATKGAEYYHNTLNIIDPQGRLLDSFPSQSVDFAWSPDSTRLVTWAGRFLAPTIAVYGLNGVRNKLLPVPYGLMHPAPGDFAPAWSPDGASLLVHTGVEIPVDGSTPHHLPTSDPRSHYFVWYSPNGAHVAYSDYLSLHVAAADGSQDRVLFSGRVDGAVWSPAGDRIAFQVFQVDAATGMTTTGPTTRIYMVDVASGKVTALTGTGTYDSPIGFSPDGQRVLFARTNAKETVSSLWMVRTDGSKPQLVVKGPEGGGWRPLSATH